MKTLIFLIKWYLIGILWATFFVGTIILVQLLKSHSYLVPNILTRLAPIVFGLGAFFGVVAYAGFGRKD